MLKKSRRYCISMEWVHVTRYKKIIMFVALWCPIALVMSWIFWWSKLLPVQDFPMYNSIEHQNGPHSPNVRDKQ